MTSAQAEACALHGTEEGSSRRLKPALYTEPKKAMSTQAEACALHGTEEGMSAQAEACALYETEEGNVHAG